MYCHSKNYEIRYTDVDFADNLKLSALLSLLEESACLSAEELGFGYSVLQPKNLGFVMVNWYLELFRPIRLNDILTVHTWPIKPKRLIVFRDFEIFCGEERVGVATSRWCIVNLADFSMAPASCVFNESMTYNENRSVEDANFKINNITLGEACYSKSVVYSDYDHYNHVNNTKYADFLLDVFAVDELKAKSLLKARITYVKQCKYGEVLQFERQQITDGVWLVEGKVDGELRIQAEFTFSED